MSIVGLRHYYSDAKIDHPKKFDSVSDFGRMNLRERSATRFYRQGCFVNKINGDYSFVQSNCVYLFTCPNMDAVRYKG